MSFYNVNKGFNPKEGMKGVFNQINRGDKEKSKPPQSMLDDAANRQIVSQSPKLKDLYQRLDDKVLYNNISPTYGSMLKVVDLAGKSGVIDLLGKHRIITAIAAAQDKGTADSNSKLYEIYEYKIEDFNLLTAQQQLAKVNEIWSCICDGYIGSTLSAEMTDSNSNVSDKGPLPSSLRPSHRDASNVTVEPRLHEFVWQKYQIGFRVEGKIASGHDEYKARVQNSGCLPLSHEPTRLKAVRGWEISDTIIADKSMIFFWKRNKDILNETGTCVSRSFFGATALPLRTTNSETDHVDFHYLLALDCKGLKGLDTEKMQKDLGGTSLWRPGEKAFYGIGPERIIAWTKLKRKPGSSQGGWMFSLPSLNWHDPQTLLPLDNNSKIDPEIRDFLDKELSAWRQDHWYTVPPTYDFTN